MMRKTDRTIELYRFALAVLLSLAVSGAAYGQNKRNASPNTQAPNSESSSKPLTARQIVDKVLPSVVVIVAQDENGEAVGQGSGFFYKPGFVATNLHVFTRASQAYAKVLDRGITYKVVEVVGIDMRRDLCVVRVDDNSTPPLVLSGANSPAVGDEVFVVSNPKGLEGSVSKGIVSGIRKDIALLQIDAAISPGSSGGAVVNDRAEVIGIAVSTLVGGQNLNFAVPVEYLSSLKLYFKVPVVVAGAFSVKDRDKEKLRGLARSVTTRSSLFGYDQRSDKYFEKPAETTAKSVYDLDGNEIEKWFYGKNGELFFKHFYAYDENGFKTRRIEEYRDGTRKEYKISLEESASEKVRDKQFSGQPKFPTLANKFMIEMGIRLS
jgi:hypothetical protein